MKLKHPRHIWIWCLLGAALAITSILFLIFPPLQIHEDMAYNLTISPSFSSGIFLIQGTGQLINNTVVAQNHIIGQDEHDRQSFEADLVLHYDNTSHTITSVKILSITGSEYLYHAQQIFITHMITPRLGQELLSWASSTNQQFSSNHVRTQSHYARSTSLRDNLNIPQSLVVTIDISCSLLERKKCDLSGDISLSTSLDSWPIHASLKGKIRPSLLQ